MIVVKEPTLTNTADRFTKALQTANLEWRNRLGMGYDNGDEVETSMREALAESGRWARVEPLHAFPRSVLIATLMQQTFVTRRPGWERLQLVEQSLSKLRGVLKHVSGIGPPSTSGVVRGAF